MENTSIRCYLNLSSDLVKPEEQKKKIEFYKIPADEYKFNKTRVDFGVELFDTGRIISLFTEDILERIINKMNHYLPNFNFNTDSLGFSMAKIEVIIQIYNGDIPSIYLNREIIEYLNRKGIEIEFDIYHCS